MQEITMSHTQNQNQTPSEDQTQSPTTNPSIAHRKLKQKERRTHIQSQGGGRSKSIHGLTQAEVEWIDASADAVGLSKSEFMIRQIFQRKIEQPMPVTDRDAINTLRKAVGLMKKALLDKTVTSPEVMMRIRQWLRQYESIIAQLKDAYLKPPKN